MIEPEDQLFVAQVLQFWKVADRAGLYAIAAQNDGRDQQEVNYAYGAMAPLVTAAAAAGVPLACAVCDRAARSIAVGVRLLGAGFADKTVLVALIGGVARSACMQQRLRQELEGVTERRYRIEDPARVRRGGVAGPGAESGGDR